MIKFTIGIDGNCWYCSNGLEIMDDNSLFTFERILQDAIRIFKEKQKEEYTTWGSKARGQCEVNIPLELKDCLEMTPKEYQQYEKDNSQFGLGG